MTTQREFADRVRPCDLTESPGLSLHFVPTSWGSESFVVVEAIRDEKTIMQFVFSRKEWRKVKRGMGRW
jgi:hypothetical protein